MEILDSLKETAAGELLITFVVAMLPVVELRGAIPLGVGMGLHPWAALTASVLGNMVPVPFIIIFIRKIFTRLRQWSKTFERLVNRIENGAAGKQELIYKYKVIGLIILVGIPLPGTGAWTGALVAALVDIRLKAAVPAIFLGVVIAGLLITGLTLGVISFF